MALYIPDKEVAIDFGIEYPTGDVVLEYVDHYGDIAVENCAVYP